MSRPSLRGVLRKMKVTLAEPVGYQLPLGEGWFPVDRRIGEPLSLTFTGNRFCVACGRKTRKSFAQGYCYPCFKRLAECDLCILRPQTCHHHLGTCRDEKWAAGHCMQPHIVYIANSSALKVGITRSGQIPTRWIDQGASQAMAVFRVKNRLHSGLLESALKKHVSDRTDWRRMLSGAAPPVDLRAETTRILAAAATDLAELKAAHAAHGLDWERLDEAPVSLSYPVAGDLGPLRQPAGLDGGGALSSLSFDKTAEIAGRLHGIKGQYLLFDRGVINIRKFSGYEVIVQ